MLSFTMVFSNNLIALLKLLHSILNEVQEINGTNRGCLDLETCCFSSNLNIFIYSHLFLELD